MVKRTNVNEKQVLDDDIITRLDIIIRLLANNTTQDKNATEAVAYLSKIGLSNKKIAETLNLKQNVVSAMLSNVKKNKIIKEKPNG